MVDGGQCRNRDELFKVENFFCKGPNSKRFQHWGPYELCQLFSSAMVVQEQLQIHL